MRNVDDPPVFLFPTVLFVIHGLQMRGGYVWRISIKIIIQHGLKNSKRGCLDWILDGLRCRSVRLFITFKDYIFILYHRRGSIVFRRHKDTYSWQIRQSGNWLAVEGWRFWWSLSSESSQESHAMMVLRRLLRKRWVLGVVFGLSLIYFLTSTLKQVIKCITFIHNAYIVFVNLIWRTFSDLKSFHLILANNYKLYLVAWSLFLCKIYRRNGPYGIELC